MSRSHSRKASDRSAFQNFDYRSGKTSPAYSINPAQPSPYSKGMAVASIQPAQNTYFKSRRKEKAEIEKPWLQTKDKRQPWATWIPIIGMLIGLALSGLLVFQGIYSTKMPSYCQILDEDFSGGLDKKIWTQEAEVGGYGNGQFEETTVTDENVFVRDNMLVIKPSLQDENLIYHNNVINLTAQGICTEQGQSWSSCVTSTNTTNGTIVNPVKSGRINTKKGATIKYGEQIASVTMLSSLTLLQVALKSKLSYQVVTGSGQPSGCCQSTIPTVPGPLLVKSILQNLVATTGLTAWAGTKSCHRLFTGVLIRLTMQCVSSCPISAVC